MKLLAAFVLCVFAVEKVIPSNTELDAHWEEYKKLHGKNYGEDEAGRREIWEEHVNETARHNLWADLGFYTYKKGINQYSDLTHEEFVRYLNGYRGIKKDIGNASSWIPPSNVVLPDYVDWRRAGLVTPVKNQGYCGSCWAFSAVGALEGQHKRKTGRLVSLSEQNLVDCSTDNYGCQGGWSTKAYLYIQRNGGIDTEQSYPYTAKKGPCRFQRSTVGATCRGYFLLTAGDENNLKIGVATVGPIAVSIDASHQGFQQYSNGIYYDPQCSSTNLNHGVLVVGYGTENGIDYWLVKNSWGTSWGMNGYVKMIRNRNNNCGTATYPVYPIV